MNSGGQDAAEISGDLAGMQVSETPDDDRIIKAAKKEAEELAKNLRSSFEKYQRMCSSLNDVRNTLSQLNTSLNKLNSLRSSNQFVVTLENQIIEKETKIDLAETEQHDLREKVLSYEMSLKSEPATILKWQEKPALNQILTVEEVNKLGLVRLWGLLSSVGFPLLKELFRKKHDAKVNCCVEAFPDAQSSDMASNASSDISEPEGDEKVLYDFWENLMCITDSKEVMKILISSVARTFLEGNPIIDEEMWFSEGYTEAQLWRLLDPRTKQILLLAISQGTNPEDLAEAYLYKSGFNVDQWDSMHDALDCKLIGEGKRLLTVKTALQLELNELKNRITRQRFNLTDRYAYQARNSDGITPDSMSQSNPSSSTIAGQSLNFSGNLQSGKVELPQRTVSRRSQSSPRLPTLGGQPLSSNMYYTERGDGRMKSQQPLRGPVAGRLAASLDSGVLNSRGSRASSASTPPPVLAHQRGRLPQQRGGLPQQQTNGRGSNRYTPYGR